MHTEEGMCRWKELCKRLDNSYLQGTAEQFFQEPLQSDIRSKLNTADELIRLLMMRSQFPTNDLIGKINCTNSPFRELIYCVNIVTVGWTPCWEQLCCVLLFKSQKAFKKKKGEKKKKQVPVKGPAPSHQHRRLLWQPVATGYHRIHQSLWSKTMTWSVLTEWVTMTTQRPANDWMGSRRGGPQLHAASLRGLTGPLQSLLI